ncbi:MAG: carbohydrate ABC transporter permease [Solirubrobacteraceae bacterium]|jgi:ABC-type glycerol-3-phosphate transport system permease component
MISKSQVMHSTRVLFATVVGLLMAAPLFYMILNSLMTTSQTADLTPQIIPNSVHFSNYSEAVSGLTQVIYGRSFLNSVIFTFFVVLFQWMLCISGGLVIAKMRFRSRTVITVMLGVSLFIPILTTLIPTFVVTLKLGLINSYPGVILPIVAQTGFGTLLFRQYIAQMPEELFDAARVDGANWWTMLRRLVVPLAKPATGAYVAISVLTAWNMYLWPLVAASSPNLEMLTQTLASLNNLTFGTTHPQNIVYAAIVIVTLPMIIVFLCVQPYFIRGLTGSGVE